ncbi:response regulator [Flavobacterium sp. ANB]|uniref:response regulator n=1 Tax=unclassified Flavobacterium TaxID=196869 RepID=UPI00188BAFE0|nr:MULTISPECIES: response regulator [unclassified Flavobacterium]MBF4519049.1 response regulator [Flavobacterium sp. ANB]
MIATKFLNTVFFVRLLFLVITTTSFSQEIILKKDQKFPLDLSGLVSIYRDSTASLTLNAVQKKAFVKSKKNYLNLPFTNHVHWVKFKLKNNSSQTHDLLLVWANMLAEQLDFYVQNDAKNGFNHKIQKIITSKTERKLIYEFPKIRIVLHPNQTKAVYIKVSSKRGQFASIRLFTKDTYYASRLESAANQGLLNGFMIFRLILILMLGFWVIKERSFRLYSLNIFFRSFAYWGYTNVAAPFLTDNPDMAAKIDFLLYSTFSVGVGFFLLFAADIKKLPKWNANLIKFSLSISVLLGVLSFLDYQWYWLKAGIFNIVLSSVYFLILIVSNLFNKTFIDKFYAIPIVFGLVGTTLLFLPLTGLLDYLPLYAFSYFLFSCEFFVFIFFLGRIIKNSEKKKRFSEQQLQLKQLQNNQLKELDDLKTRFFTNISHEFRTPLTLLVGPVDDLQKKYPNESILKIMQRNLSRLQNLINQILEISKLEAGEMRLQKEEADIAQFLIQIVASFESLAQDKGIVFNYSIPQKAVFGHFDLDKIEKIMTNLLSNAFKFTPRNGRVVVKIDFEDLHTQNNKKPSKTTQLLQINIQDFGIGIAPERLPYIFNRFYQIDDSNQRLHEGSGIGLALVKELIAILEGTITVESKLDQGTKFTLNLPYEPLNLLSENAKLPILKLKPEVVFEENNSRFEDSENNENAQIMLIVEDNPDLRFYIASIFENQYQLLIVADGEEGLAKAIEFVPDIVISDLMMPKLDGLSLCTKLKNDERTSHIPVIMLTAKASIDDKLVGLQQGADDYLSKPFNREELNLRVSNLIQQRQSLREKYTRQTIAIEPEIVVMPETTLEDLFIEKAQTVINNYLSQSEFDAATFASEMQLSPVQLRRKLKAITNQTGTEFVRNYRLEKASEMLKKGDKTVSQVAYEVGFESLPYFSKVFQEKFGKTASEWR